MRRTLIAPVSFGLGDLVVSLPPIQALIEDDPPVWLVARAPSQRLLAERIGGLAGVVDEAELAGGPADRFIDLRDHPLQRDFWWGSDAFEAEFGRLNINDILQRICCRPWHQLPTSAARYHSRPTLLPVSATPFCWCTKRTAPTRAGRQITGPPSPPFFAQMATTSLRC